MLNYSPESLGIDIEAVDRQLTENRSFPIHTYFDPAVYEFELEAIFHRKWQYFGLLEHVANPGDVMVGMVGRIPVVVTRDKQGVLHGFVNICRHRGFRVVEGNKRKCGLLVCRYHKWAYKLNGELAGAPDSNREPDFDAAAMSLVPVSVDTWGPAVFVNPDAGAAPLREHFPNLDPWTEKFEFIMEPGRYTLHREIVKDQQSNWKLWYDNGTECYHCDSIHGKSFGEAFATKSGEYEFYLDGDMTSYAFPPSSLPVENESDGYLRSQTYRSFQTFPGCQIIQHDDLMIISRMVPTGPESCQFISHYLAEKGADPDRVDRWIGIWDETFQEDAEVASTQQTNMRSGKAELFRYIPNREAPTQYINRCIWNAYKAHFSNASSTQSVTA